MITRSIRPYEFLVRWGAAGKIAGAHVQFVEEIIEDAVAISSRPGVAEAVSLAGEVGFPLEDILSQAQVDAIGTTTAALAQLAETQAVLRQRDADLQQSEASAEALRGRLAVVESSLSQAAATIEELRARDKAT